MVCPAMTVGLVNLAPAVLWVIPEDQDFREPRAKKATHPTQKLYQDLEERKGTQAYQDFPVDQVTQEGKDSLGHQVFRANQDYLVSRVIQADQGVMDI